MVVIMKSCMDLEHAPRMHCACTMHQVYKCCYYRDNYLQQLRFYVAPPPATRTFGSIHTVIGHIVDNLPLVTSIRIRPKILWRNFRRSVTDLDYLVISYRFHQDVKLAKPCGLWSQETLMAVGRNIPFQSILYRVMIFERFPRECLVNSHSCIWRIYALCQL